MDQAGKYQCSCCQTQIIGIDEQPITDITDINWEQNPLLVCYHF